MDPGPRGHPDQARYILTWQYLVKNPPHWLKLFLFPPASMAPTPPGPPPPAIQAMIATTSDDKKLAGSKVLSESAPYPSALDLEAKAVQPTAPALPPLLPPYPWASSLPPEDPEPNQACPTQGQLPGGPAFSTGGRHQTSKSSASTDTD